MGKTINGKEKITHPTSKQCPFCEFFFTRSAEAIKKHTKVCRAKKDVTYTFDNSNIISFQNNFKYMGDAPFTAPFDFETTTGNAVFLYPKMYVLSYCQIYAFHPNLNLEKNSYFLKL